MSNLEFPEVESTEIAYDGYVQIRYDHLHYTKRNVRAQHTVIDVKADAVMLLATTPDGNYIINKEYRHSPKKVLLTCPGGRIDEGEDPSLAALRELREETGYQVKEAHLIGQAFPFPGLSDQKIFFYRGENAERVGTAHPDPAESFETVEMSPEELFEQIQKGSANDGILLTALMFDQLNGKSSPR